MSWDIVKRQETDSKGASARTIEAKRLLLGLALGFALALFTTCALACPVVQTRQGEPRRWIAARDIQFDFLPFPEADHAAVNDMVSAATAAASAWNHALKGCSVPTLLVAQGRSDAEVGCDYHNVIVVRTTYWCRNGSRNADDCYDQSRSALTHIYSHSAINPSDDKAIAEADIEINAVNFDYVSQTDRSTYADAFTIFLHEFGHVLGLDHSCTLTLEAVPSTGQQGQSLLPCSDPVTKASLMSPGVAEPGTPPFAGPGADEIETLCRLYGDHRNWIQRHQFVLWSRWASIAGALVVASVGISTFYLRRAIRPRADS